MDMPWPALRSLHELARLGTIAAVAETRGYTAGAISQQLAVLERAVGRPLLVRVGRGVRLTDAGSVLARHAHRILEAEEEARRALEAATDDVAGTVRVASFATSAATLLAPSIAIAAERYPHLDVMTLEIDVDAVAAAVQRGDAELAFGLDYPDAPVPRAAGVELVRVTSERFALAAPAAWNLAGPMSVRAAADHGWILPPEDTNYGRAVRAACRRAGFEPRVTHLVTDTAVSLAMVGQGVGVTMTTPMMLALAPARGLQTVAITEDVLRHVVLIRRAADRDRPIVRAVTSVIEEVVRRATTPPVPPAPHRE
jgi:DNA-binding transcriptional LysR family regulator